MATTTETRRRVSVRYNGLEDERYLGYEEGRVVYFDDGETSPDVDPKWITYVEEVTIDNARVGLRVEARVPDDSRVYPGEIVEIHADGTFAIAFDDGDRVDDARDVFAEAKDEEAELWDQVLDTETPQQEPEGGGDHSADNHPRSNGVEYDDGGGLASPESYSSYDKDEKRAESFSSDNNHSTQQQQHRPLLTDCWGFKPDDNEDLGGIGIPIPANYVPKVEATLSRQLRTLRTSLTAVAEAPPYLRLAQLQYEAATLEQARAHHEAAGCTWEYGGKSPCLDWNSATAAITHVDALLQLRMRAVAVCRILYGSTSLEIVQAVLDLSQAYAQNKMWVQACNHAERALHILRLVEEPGKENSNRNDAEEDEQDSTLPSAVQELFERLATLAHESEFGGVFPWSAFVATLNSIGIQSLAEQPWGIRQGGSQPGEPTCGRAMKWSGAVAFLRKHHRGFASAIRKIERSLSPSDLALLLFIFDAASKTEEETGGVASPVALRSAAVRTRATAAAFAETGFAKWLAQQCQRQVAASSVGSDAVVIPLTWEQTVSAFYTTTKVKASKKIADLRGAATLVIGRAHANDGRLAKARSSLRSALQYVAHGATASAAHSTLADVLIAEHVAWEQTADERARKKAEEWLATDEGHRIWRDEVKRLIAEMRIKGTPGLVQLTRPEIECRARDVLLHARVQYIKKSSTSKRDRLEAARSHLQSAFECEKVIHGLHRNDYFRAAIAKSAIGTLAIVAGNDDEAIAVLSEALSSLLAATNGAHHVASANIAVQLGHLLRRKKTGATSASAAECLAAAAQFNLDLAQKAEADASRYASLNAMTEAMQLTHSHRVALASEARSSAARKARSLWNEVVALIDKTFAGRYEENMGNALGKVYAASKLAEGDSSIAAMKALRKLAKFQADNSMSKEASTTYLELQNIALRAGDSDTANKASRAARCLNKKIDTCRLARDNT